MCIMMNIKSGSIVKSQGKPRSLGVAVTSTMVFFIWAATYSSSMMFQDLCAQAILIGMMMPKKKLFVSFLKSYLSYWRQYDN